MTTTVTVAGNITRDPELRFIASGAAVATFGVAVSSRRKDASGNWVDGDTSFFDVTCWRDLAENVAESLTKGVRVVVVGRLQQRTWETKDGDKRSKVEVVADEVGVSLRWATVEIHRTERREPANYATGTADGYGADEEPF